MMLMIRENDLETVLANRRNFIGIAPRLESALTIITGVFYVASAVVMEDLWWKIPMYVLGAIVTIYGIAGVIRKPYTTKQLFKEIAGMNAIASSIIAISEPGISDSNKYLVYWDTKWKCWFFPNRRSTPSVPDDERDLRNYLHAEFKVPQDDCTLEYKTDGESTKYSTEHDEMRYYDYRIYRGVVSALPDSWSVDGPFDVGGHRCKWMTIDEMLADEETDRINHDVIVLVRDNA